MLTTKNSLLAILAVALTACGGSDVVVESSPAIASPVSGSGSPSYSLTTPTKLTSIPALGSASFTTAVTDYGMGTISFPQSTSTALGYGYPDAIYSAAASASFQIYPVKHITSEITSAWDSGWTGQGVTISVIDDFYSLAGTVVKDAPMIERTAVYEVSTSDYGKVKGTYEMVYSWSRKWAHGSSVANIAGGDYDGQQITYKSVLANVKKVAKNGCETLRAGPNNYTLSCDSDFYIQALGSNEKTFDMTYKKVAGVAKQSNVVNNNVNLSSTQNPIQTVADIQGHLLNSSSLGVINLSLGSQFPTSGKTFAQVMEEVEKTPISNIDAVIIVAAGNGGAPCATQDLNGCNPVAVAMAFQGATKNNTIVVGATSGTGSSENIATYSTRAGILAERFVLASGDEGNENVVGTSFSAPRVSGIAAILKQKYPALTSAQIANVILLSASKDINNDGIDDFAGVSQIYGHGKASLTRALSLAGAL